MFTLYSPMLAAEPLASNSGSDFSAMLVRILFFLLFLLVFVFVCGYAWRTLPGLRAILPRVEKRVRDPITLSLADEPEQESTTTTNYISESENKLGLPEVEVLTRQKDPIASAVADGRPGSVVQVASDLDSPSAPPILFVRRIDNAQD